MNYLSLEYSNYYAEKYIYIDQNRMKTVDKTFFDILLFSSELEMPACVLNLFVFPKVDKTMQTSLAKKALSKILGYSAKDIFLNVHRQLLQVNLASLTVQTLT